MKNPWAMSDKEERIARLQEFSEAGGSQMQIYLVRSNDFGLARAANRGNLLARLLISAVKGGLKEIAESKPAKLCAFCNEKVSTKQPPGAMIVWLPGEKAETAFKSGVVMQAVCDICCDDNDEEILGKAFDLVKVIFPEAIAKEDRQ